MSGPCYNETKGGEEHESDIAHDRSREEKNGKWTTYIKEFEEDIPDLGRHCLMCNSCGEPSYPECMKKCPVERDRVEREQKKAREKIAKHKVEIDILAGLVRDGLLKVEDAAPRVDMSVEEFEAAMPK